MLAVLVLVRAAISPACVAAPCTEPARLASLTFDAAFERIDPGAFAVEAARVMPWARVQGISRGGAGIVVDLELVEVPATAAARRAARALCEYAAGGSDGVAFYTEHCAESALFTSYTEHGPRAIFVAGEKVRPSPAPEARSEPPAPSEAPAPVHAVVEVRPDKQQESTALDTYTARCIYLGLFLLAAVAVSYWVMHREMQRRASEKAAYDAREGVGSTVPPSEASTAVPDEWSRSYEDSV